MNRLTLIGIAFLALHLHLGLAVLLAADEAKPFRLSVLLAPDEEPVTVIKFPLALDATVGTRQIFVRNADAAAKDPLVGVGFYLQLQDDHKVPIGTVTLTAENASTPEASIPGNGHVTAVQLKVEGIDRFGKFEGALIATRDTLAVTLAVVTVERTPKPKPKPDPKLEFLDAPAGDVAITFKTDTPAFARSIRIRATDDADVKINSIAILPFLATNASLVIARDPVFKDENGKAFDLTKPLAAGKSIAIDVSARFEETTNYTGVLRIEYQGGSLQRGIAITRDRPEPKFEVLGVENVYGTRSWRSEPIRWRFGVHEMDGKPRELNVPRLVNFGLDEEVQKGQAHYNEPVFRDGETLTQLTKPWQLAAGEIKPLTMEISGLSSSGKYSGTVQIGQADGQSRTKTIHLLVKESWLVPGICICVGVVISFFIRLAVNRWQPQLSRLKRASELSEELTRVEKAAEPMDPDERKVLEGFRERWNIMNRRIDESKFTEADAIDAELGSKLTLFPLWLNTYRRWKAIKPPAVVEGLKERLEAVQNFLMDESADTTATDAQRIGLKKIDAEITDKVAADLQKCLDDFENQVKARRDPSSTPAEEKKRLDDNVLNHMQPARDALEQGNLEIYRQEFAKARGEYVLFLADELATKLAVPERPIGFQAANKEADWLALTRDVNSLLSQARQVAEDDPDLATRHYQAAYTRYFTALLAGADIVVKRTNELIHVNVNDKRRDGSIDPDAKAKKDAYLQQVVDWGNKLYEAERSLKAGKLQSAFECYRAATDGLRVLAAELKAEGIGQVQMSEVNGRPVDLQVAARAALGQAVTGPAAEAITKRVAQLWVSPRLSVNQIKWIRIGLEIALAIAAMVMAILLGLKLLWATDPTWGSADDLLTAVLWGLGLHQVSGATIGSQGLLDKFVTPADGKK